MSSKVFGPERMISLNPEHYNLSNTITLFIGKLSNIITLFIGKLSNIITLFIGKLSNIITLFIGKLCLTKLSSLSLLFSENLEKEDEFQTQVMTLNNHCAV